jgi:hypothetical protein
MSWTTSKDELRAIVSDGPTDRLRHRKRLIGTINGVNTVFKTLEPRLITNFTSAVAPEGVYVDGVAAPITSADQVVGEISLTTPPADGSIVEATYYAQWFLDSELDIFLLSAAQWLLFEAADQIPPGLRPAAIHYAAQEAYMKLSLKWAEHLSETYRLEDAPKEGAYEIVTQYQNAAKAMHTKSMALKDNFYTRSGKNKQPLFASLAGRVADPMPKR